MGKKLSIVESMRILEIGCGPGAAARELARRIGKGHVLAIDRSEKAIQQAIAGSEVEIKSGKLSFRQSAAEHFELEKGEQRYDMAFAVRVGALDGRHPEIEKQVLSKIAKALKPNGKLFIDDGDPLKEIALDKWN